MRTQMDHVKDRLFGDGGFGVLDIKMFPGANRETMPEAFANELNRALTQIEEGDYELIENFDD